VFAFALALQSCTIVGAVSGATQSLDHQVTSDEYKACMAERDRVTARDAGDQRDCTDPAQYPRKSRGDAVAKGALIGLGIDTVVVLVFVLALESRR